MRELKPCGTEAAYKRHLRRGEKADRACMDASARTKLDQKRRRAERAKEVEHQTSRLGDAVIERFKADMAERYADEGNAA